MDPEVTRRSAVSQAQRNQRSTISLKRATHRQTDRDPCLCVTDAGGEQEAAVDVVGAVAGEVKGRRLELWGMNELEAGRLRRCPS